jgi:hypothetical protein
VDAEHTRQPYFRSHPQKFRWPSRRDRHEIVQHRGFSLAYRNSHSHTNTVAVANPNRNAANTNRNSKFIPCFSFSNAYPHGHRHGIPNTNAITLTYANSDPNAHTVAEPNTNANSFPDIESIYNSYTKSGSNANSNSDRG